MQILNIQSVSKLSVSRKGDILLGFELDGKLLCVQSCFGERKTFLYIVATFQFENNGSADTNNYVITYIITRAVKQ